jgi:hypothetical protein
MMDLWSSKKPVETAKERNAGSRHQTWQWWSQIYMRGYSNGRDFVLHSSSGDGLLSSKLLHHLPPAVLQPFPLNLLTAQKEGVPLTNDIIVCTPCTICRCVQMQQKCKTITNKTSQTNCNVLNNWKTPGSAQSP